MAAASELESPSPNMFIPEEWANAAEAIAHGSVAFPISLVCGPKNSGKTTFSRHLVNVLLQRHKKVAYLDTDVGQTEFTPPGILSLTVIDQKTPDLTIPRLKTPTRCFFYGDISSKRDPAAYLSYICSLYDHYLKEYDMRNNAEFRGSDELPLVINTPGWVKGIGYQILVDMIKYISPTHVVKIKISAEGKNLPAGAFWLEEGNADTVTVIEIKAALQDHMKRSVLVQKDSRLLRDLRLMAYFRQCFPSDMTISTIKELARALAAHPPYEISILSTKIKHLHCQVPVAETFYSSNATIVGLAVSSASEQLPQCVGLGIVRSIDTFRGALYVITPVPQQTLENVDLLLQGFIQIPASLLQDFCIADLRGPVSVNGFPCKPVLNVTSDDFFFDGLSQEGNTNNTLGSNVNMGNVLAFPGLNTLGISMNRVDIAPGGLNPPHLHPRATESGIVIQGNLLVGLITTGNVLFAKNLSIGQMFVIPRGLVHFQLNVGQEKALLFTAFNSQLPGALSVALNLFSSSPTVPDSVLTKAFQVDQTVVDQIKSRLGG